LVLAKDLMERRLLSVPQCAKVPRLIEDDRIGRDCAVLIAAEIRTDLRDESRDVIEKRTAWKDLLRVYGEEIGESIKPARGKVFVLGSDPRRDQVAEIRGDHRDGSNG